MIQIEGLIEYTDFELEQMAHDYLRARPDVQLKIPINVEALLQGCAGLGDIDTVPDITKYTRTEGVICRHTNGNDLKVFLDEATTNFGPKANYYAVVAEELSHILLHQSIFIQVKSITDFIEVQKSAQWHRIERDAKRLSAAIRMPYKNVILAAQDMYPEIVDEHGFGEAWAVNKLLRNALAEKFVVPQVDMHRRLMQWPCQIYDRAAISIQSQMHSLVSADYVPRTEPPRKQANLF
jgi:hypothetical protein